MHARSGRKLRSNLALSYLNLLSQCQRQHSHSCMHAVFPSFIATVRKELTVFGWLHIALLCVSILWPHSKCTNLSIIISCRMDMRCLFMRMVCSMEILWTRKTQWTARFPLMETKIFHRPNPDSSKENTFIFKDDLALVSGWWPAGSYSIVFICGYCILITVRANSAYVVMVYRICIFSYKDVWNWVKSRAERKANCLYPAFIKQGAILLSFNTKVVLMHLVSLNICYYDLVFGALVPHQLGACIILITYFKPLIFQFQECRLFGNI